VTSPKVIAPGNHDGVHLGHQALVRSARAHAQEHGLRTVALTFDPHPAALIAPERAPTPLTTMARRTELLRAAGADEVVVQPFTRAFASLGPDEFLKTLLDRGARALVVGPDFRFGKDRAGDVALLREFGAAHGLHVLVEPPVRVAGERVSSSAVREAIARGDVARAAVLLDHVPELTGSVVAGDRRGRDLGFPTANLETEPVLHPADGVYAVVARVLDREPREILRGVVNLGVRPTAAAGRAVEVHLLDWSGDLYGTRLRVGFLERIRPEKKFPDLEALKAQIAVDCAEARATLEAADEGSWRWI
jgi:riboflavin kinase / FMN adenylyltransferase